MVVKNTVLIFSILALIGCMAEEPVDDEIDLLPGYCMAFNENPPPLADLAEPLGEDKLLTVSVPESWMLLEETELSFNLQFEVSESYNLFVSDISHNQSNIFYNETSCAPDMPFFGIEVSAMLDGRFLQEPQKAKGYVADFREVPFSVLEILNVQFEAEFEKSLQVIFDDSYPNAERVAWHLYYVNEAEVRIFSEDSVGSIMHIQDSRYTD